MVDDEKSIYVGGIPYDSTEDSLRCVFDLYGAVTAVKIINDKKVGGKCFAFVTFSNPRSAQDAIMDMNQRTIGGRVVHVNEVHTRTNTNREYLSRGESYERERGRERNTERERERERPNYQYRYNGNRYRERSASLSRDRERKRESSSDVERERGRERKRDRSVDRFSDNDQNEDVNKDHSNVKKPLGERLKGHESGENADLDELRVLLKKRIEKHDDIQRKVDFLKDKIDEKRLNISDLQKKSKKLEHGLVSAQKITFERKVLLNKLHKCFVQFMSYTEKIKVSEKELEGLINDAMNETDKDESLARENEFFCC
ncbi:hypothetical protein LUZ60_012293 [Juncus effusus]|nr:hypothetical protein LUZ60_012293 [Juncus effusus]